MRVAVTVVVVAGVRIWLMVLSGEYVYAGDTKSFNLSVCVCRPRLAKQINADSNTSERCLSGASVSVPVVDIIQQFELKGC